MFSFDFSNFEECQWSRKQAELFTAQQANLLQINEKKAMPAKQLQKTIMQIMNDIPEYADIVSKLCIQKPHWNFLWSQQKIYT